MNASSAAGAQDAGRLEPWPGPAGWFGKLRALGDFASRRLPPEFVEPWDEWLSEELFAAEQQLGEDWPDAYASAPTWRFALSAGVLGTGPWLGVLMPSVDRVGRQFPLTFAASFEPHAHTLGRWWNGLLRIAAQVNAQPAWDLETLEAALQALPRGAEGEAPRRFVQELQSATDGSSLWWPPGDDVDADGSVTVVDGLPRGRQFVRLIRPGLQFRPWSG